MPLNEVEYQSAVWKKIKSHLEIRLNILRKENDVMHIDVIVKNQGRIAELKSLIGLDRKPLMTEDEYEE